VFSFHPPGKNVILFTGNYGSGKTEVAVNVVSALAKSGEKVIIGDLDLVNPYFRCREARTQLEELGAKVVAPDAGMNSADLPILLPEIRGAVEHPNDITVLDVGGDNVGATVLSTLTPVFKRIEYEMIFVLNQNRPFTDTVEGALTLMSEIEHASRLKITSIAGNTHLMDETDFQMIKEGAIFTEAVAGEKGVPVSFITSLVSVLHNEKLLDSPGEQLWKLIEFKDFPAPVFPMERIMLPPWLGGTPPGILATHSRDGFARISK